MYVLQSFTESFQFFVEVFFRAEDRVHGVAPQMRGFGRIKARFE